jgi:hypothetical protein
MPPGALVAMGEAKIKHAQLSLFRYDETNIHEQSELDLSGLDMKALENGVLWLNIHGLHDIALMTEIGRVFTLHPLLPLRPYSHGIQFGAGKPDAGPQLRADLPGAPHRLFRPDPRTPAR